MAKSFTDLNIANATETAKAIAEGHVSALEACDAAIERIEQRNDAVNAVIIQDFDCARENAKMLDESRIADDPRPLLGVPMTVKESIDVEGLPSSWGFPASASNVAECDSIAAQRLKSAGAIILGKTNIPVALADWQSDSPVYGRTMNPYDYTRSPGGSSGGAAAALATGMVPLEVGSDIGGSVRIPAHFCGVFGHKSTYGIIPMKGHNYPGADALPPELAVLGPLARSAGDLAVALDVLAGPPDTSPYALTLPVAPQKPLSEYRVLVLDAHPAIETDRMISEPLNLLAEKLEHAGVSIVRNVDGMPDLSAAHSNYRHMLLSIITRDMPGGTPVDAHGWMDLKDQQMRCARQWNEVFKHVDVVLSPPFGVAAFPHNDNPDWSARRLIINGREEPYGTQVAWPGLATFPGLPATVAPIGLSDAGLPVGVQIMGGSYCDHTTIEFASLLEREGFTQSALQ